MANGELIVCEYSGTARSGKGTIVSHIAQTYEGVASDETGADYRALTRFLLADSWINPDMSPDVITKAVAGLDVGMLAEAVASRKAIVETHGIDSLYTSDVEDAVKYVSPVDAVRTAVKAGFTERVKAVRDAGEQAILLVDGRNLAPVVSRIPRTRLVLRTFVSCLTIEAAWRECSRLGIPLGSIEAQEKYDSTEQRNNKDASRLTDPAVPDADAIDYWHDPFVFDRTISHHRLRGESDMSTFTRLFNGSRDYTSVPRYGAGALAVETGRQILFDTTHFRPYDDPKGSMLEAAEIMFSEMLDRLD